MLHSDSAEFFATFFATTPRYAAQNGVDSSLCYLARSRNKLFSKVGNIYEAFKL
jgi:hypothetical protein